jgi:hypothetical protein
VVKSSIAATSIFAVAVAACSGGANVAPGGSAASVISQTSTFATRGTSAVTASAASQSLCVSGTTYQTVQDDEFSQDAALNYTSGLPPAVEPAGQMLWSTQYSWGSRFNNDGADDAFYTDPSQGFGGYTPSVISGGTLNITAEPVPSGYADPTDGTPRHWLSGVLVGSPLRYGYVEVSAEEPNLQGFWPAPLWLLSSTGGTGKAPNLTELDANEVFGNVYPPGTINQTIHYGSYTSSLAAQTVVTPQPDTAYHTYGILWTSAGAQFFIDRLATSPMYPAKTLSAMYPYINLGVFASATWAAPPVTSAPQTMRLQYYRWYQNAGASCSPSVITGPTPTPTSTPRHRH